MTTTRRSFQLGLAGLALGATGVASAQSDNAPLKLLVGFPPGGSTDSVARLLGDKLRTVLRTPVVVDNKPGVGGRLAAAALKTAAPDGLTYMVAPNATGVFQHLLYPASVLKYDLLADFVPVGMLVSYPLALAVHSRMGVHNIKEYLAYLRANPKDTNFGTAGLGGHTHFSGVQLGKALGLNLQVVPYRGNGPLVTDLLGGQVAAGVMTAGDIAAHEKSGAVRLIGVFGGKRSPLLPHVPTLKEQGVNLDTGDAWAALWAPARTPKAEIERMQGALKLVLGLPEVRDALATKSMLTADYRPGEEVNRILRKELAYWGGVIKETGFKPDA